MNVLSPPITRRRLAPRRRLCQIRQSVTLFVLLVLFPALALAQSGSPFDTGFTNLQTLFTGTVAKVGDREISSGILHCPKCGIDGPLNVEVQDLPA